MAEWRTAAVAFGVVVLVSSCTSDDGDTGRAAAPRALPTAAPAHAYRVTYRVTELGRVRDEEVLVRRPYDSRRVSTRGGRRTSGTMTNGRGLWTWSDGKGGWHLVDPGRRLAEGDPRLLGALPHLVEEGLARIAGDDRVAGRRCSLVRTGEPIGNPAATAPTASDHVELCLDATGVVLRERWVIDGRMVRHQEAGEVVIDPPLTDADFAAEPTASSAGGDGAGRSLVDVGDDVLASSAVVFDRPKGVVEDGSHAWVVRDPTGGVRDGGLHRFYRRGDDVVDVEEVPTDEEEAERGAPFRTRVGPGRLESNLHHLTLRIPVGDVTVVVRASTFDLVRDMASAVRRQGTEVGRP